MSNQTPGKQPDDEPSLGGEDLPELPPLASSPIDPLGLDAQLPPSLLPPQLGTPVESTPLATPHLPPPTGLPPQTHDHGTSHSHPLLPPANQPLPPQAGQPVLPPTAGQSTPMASPTPTPAAVPVERVDQRPINGSFSSPVVPDSVPAAPDIAGLPPQAIPAATVPAPTLPPVVPRQPEQTVGRASTSHAAEKPGQAGGGPRPKKNAPPAASRPTSTPPPSQPTRREKPAQRPAGQGPSTTTPPVPRPEPTAAKANVPDAPLPARAPKQERPSTAKKPNGADVRPVTTGSDVAQAGAASAGSKVASRDTLRATSIDAKPDQTPTHVRRIPAEPIGHGAAKTPTVAADVANIEPTDSYSPHVARQKRGFIVLQSTPPWMISTIIHMCLLMMLALFYVPNAVVVLLEIVVEQSVEVGDQLVNEIVVIPSLNASDVADLEVVLLANEVDNPLAAKRKIEIELNEFEPKLEAADASTTGAALDGRKKGAKRALLLAYGGTGQTEDSVQLGLEWLKRNQQRDGSWSLEGPYQDGGSFENKPAAIAMALLAFQGAGNTHIEGEFKRSVERGVQALLKLQDREGTVLRHVRVENHRLYTQAQVTIVLSELYGMTQDEALRKPAQLALDYAVKIQADDGQGGGGWRYMPSQYVDTSVTGWFVMALQSGKMAGLNVPESAFEKVSRYLDHVTDDGINYQYMPDYDPSIAMTAEALLCRQYLGWQRDDPRLIAGVKQILRQPIDWSQRDVYYWYYATQVLHHMGREPWDQWNLKMRTTLPMHQETSGRDRGSWSPIGDGRGSEGGRLYTTCFCLYMLEVYYRHLPIYR